MEAFEEKIFGKKYTVNYKLDIITHQNKKAGE